MESQPFGAVIKVVGVGGGGGNAVNRMIIAKVNSCEYIAMNTDVQALYMSHAKTKIQIGKELTAGLGAGSDPDIGRRAAEESIDEIRAALEGTHLLFITAGMGGGTGTGAAPVVAKVAREMDILTIAVVTKPFETFEGRPRMEHALEGIEELKKYVDTLIVIPNEKINSFAPKGTSIVKAFQIIDDVLRQAIQGITDIIVRRSLINLDFADIKKIMKNSVNAHIGIGRGKGENKVLDAMRQAVQSPLLETNIQGARGVIVYVVGGLNLDTQAVTEANRLIREVVDPNANIIVGLGIDKEMEEEVMVTIIATGFQGQDKTYLQNPYHNAKILDTLSMGEDNNYEAMYGQEKETSPISSQPEVKAEPVAATSSQDIPSSRMKVDDSNLPPFIRKLKNLK